VETATDIEITSIVDSLRDGLYVCDLERRITYWSKSAERITGWTAEDVLGRQCFDNVLCHIDKDVTFVPLLAYDVVQWLKETSVVFRDSNILEVLKDAGPDWPYNRGSTTTSVAPAVRAEGLYGEKSRTFR